MSVEFNHRMGIFHLDTHSTNIRNHNRESFRVYFKARVIFRLLKNPFNALGESWIYRRGANRAVGDDARRVRNLFIAARLAQQNKNRRKKFFYDFSQIFLPFSCCCFRERAGWIEDGMFIELPEGNDRECESNASHDNLFTNSVSQQ
jgi:hypothetical protein